MQFEHVLKAFGFFAWCARLEFLRALDILLRGTAMVIYSYIIINLRKDDTFRQLIVLVLSTFLILCVRDSSRRYTR